MKRKAGTRTRIKLDPRNARRHGEGNKALIRESLEAVGPLRSIGVDGDNIIRAGNGVYEQAEAMGLKVKIVDAKPDELIAVRRHDLKGKKAIEAALYDNRAGETSEWDTDVLAEIAARDGKLIQRLFEGDREIMKAIAPPAVADAEPQIDRAEELRKKWGTATGQLWRIGEHRLLCGDSTKREDVERVMGGGEKAKLFATDPPYGVSFGDNLHPSLNRTKHWDVIQNDQLSGDDTKAFLESVFTAWLPYLSNDAAWYIWHAPKVQGYFAAAAAAAADVIYHRQIVWVKPRLILGRGHFHWRHELCLYGWRKGHEARKPEDRSLTTVWQFDRDAACDYLHPTQKPIECFSWPMQYSTHLDDICAEPFCGSGTQILAAEQMGRRCRAIEIAPQYVAVALERMATAFPGIEIELLNGNGKPKARHARPKAKATAHQ